MTTGLWYISGIAFAFIHLFSTRGNIWAGACDSSTSLFLARYGMGIGKAAVPGFIWHCFILNRSTTTHIDVTGQLGWEA